MDNKKYVIKIRNKEEVNTECVKDTDDTKNPFGTGMPLHCNYATLKPQNNFTEFKCSTCGKVIPISELDEITVLKIKQRIVPKMSKLECPHTFQFDGYKPEPTFMESGDISTCYRCGKQVSLHKVDEKMVSEAIDHMQSIERAEHLLEINKKSVDNMSNDDIIINTLKKLVQLGRINKNQCKFLIESDYMSKTNQPIRKFKSFLINGDLNTSTYICLAENIRDFINANIVVDNESYDKYKIDVFLEFEKTILDYGIKGYDITKIYKEYVLPEIKSHDKVFIVTAKYEHIRKQLEYINNNSIADKLLYRSRDIDSVNNLYILLQYCNVGSSPSIVIYSPTSDIRSKYKSAYKKLVLDM